MEYIEADNYQLTEVMRAGDKALHKRLVGSESRPLRFRVPSVAATNHDMC